MSHTDKHRPFWVQVKDPDNKGWREEKHNHRKGFCDLGDPDDPYSYGDNWHYWHMRTRWPSCTYDYSKLAYCGGMWPKMPRKGGWGRSHRDGKARMRLRALKAEVLKVHRSQMYYADWEDQLPDWNEHKPTNAWLWWKSD